MRRVMGWVCRDLCRFLRGSAVPKTQECFIGFGVVSFM